MAEPGSSVSRVPAAEVSLLSWEDAFRAGPGVCGGKGFHLARLHRYGFDVPAGGVVSTAVYDAVAAQLPPAALARVAATPGDRATDPEVARALEVVRDAIARAALPVPAADALDAFLRDQDLASAAVAVRSSATGEDGDRASFAGIHRSVLNVRGRAAVVRAMLDCYASLWTPQAVAYRRRMGFADADVRCAVVICRMVQASGRDEPVAAGVAFTFDPLTGRRDLVVIDAASGLGEAVVSGRVTPAHIVFRESAGALVAHERGAGSPLSPEQERSLAQLLRRAHWALGDAQVPQDVEWAFDGERFWLLQARPATNVRRPLPEALATVPRYWSTANIKDAVPGVVSMLAWSLIKRIVERIAFAGPIVAAYPLPPGAELVRRVAGRGYFDLTLMQWVMYDALGVMPAEMVEAIGGHQPEIPVPGDPLRGPHGSRRKRARLALMRRLLGTRRALRRAVEHQGHVLRELRAIDLTELSSADLARVLERVSTEQTSLDLIAGLANAAAGPWQLALGGALRSLFGDRGPGMTSRLLTGTGVVTSAEHGYAILQLAEIARGDEAASAWLASRAPGLTWVDLPPSSPFRAALGAFLERYGHRAVYEADILNARWADDPTYIADEVRHLLAQPPREDPRAVAARIRGEAERELRQRSWWRAPIVRWLARRFSRSTAMREEAKSALAASIVPARRVALEVGRRLVASGRFASPDQIFHLSVVELQAWLDGSWDGRGAGALADDRARQRARWLDEPTPPDVIAEDPRGHVTTHAAVAARDGDRWTGIGVAPGRARGVARLVRHPHEADRLMNGDILVAPSTDPGWTPLFLRAAAIVMETGGYLSHGAIVAREYGIPAVVNVPGILDDLADGDVLVVDGDASQVVRETPAAG